MDAHDKNCYLEYVLLATSRSFSEFRGLSMRRNQSRRSLSPRSCSTTNLTQPRKLCIKRDWWKSQVEALVLNDKTKDLRIRELDTQQTGITEKTLTLEDLLERIEKVERRLAEKS